MIRSLAARVFQSGTPRAFLSTLREPGAVGLSVGDDPRKTLTDIYSRTLEVVKELPETAAYRTNVEKITKYRMGVVDGADDIEKIEATLNIGQIQEIIEQAENELELIPHMAEWKPWEMKEEQTPPVINVVD